MSKKYPAKEQWKVLFYKKITYSASEENYSCNEWDISAIEETYLDKKEAMDRYSKLKERMYTKYGNPNCNSNDKHGDYVEWNRSDTDYCRIEIFQVPSFRFFWNIFRNIKNKYKRLSQLL